MVEVSESLGVWFKGGDGAHGGFLEHTEGVALCEEFVDVTSRQGTLEEKHDVLNHVLVGNEVEEGGEGFDCLGAYILELGHKLS